MLIGAVIIWLVGSGRRLGFFIGLASQFLWLAYSLTTRQYGFLVSVLLYGAIYVRNIRHTRPRNVDSVKTDVVFTGQLPTDRRS